MAKIYHWIGPVAAALALNVVGIGVYLLWTEPHPIEHFSRRALPFVVSPGSTVTVYAEAERTKGGCSSRVIREWIGDGGIVFERSEAFGPDLPAGKEPPLKFILKVPTNVAPGPLLLRTNVEFFCNSVQRLIGGDVLKLNDISFEVIR